jgi:hypothetical protein
MRPLELVTVTSVGVQKRFVTTDSKLGDKGPVLKSKPRKKNLRFKKNKKTATTARRSPQT